MKVKRVHSSLVLVLLAALWFSALLGLILIPHDAELPVHWNIHGDPDLWAPAWLAVLFMPLTGTFVTLFITALQTFGDKSKVDGGFYIVRSARSSVLALLLGIQVTFLLIGLGEPVDIMSVVATGTGVLFAVVGNSLPKSRPNQIGGLRLPWIMQDEQCWQRTHIWTGRFMMLSGVLLIFGALSIETPELLVTAILIAALFPLLAGTLISLRWRSPGH
ncbi:SdpI family protein [Labrenzia sp. PHM005]|uniref:SdpI family protein n=1 Tax=Labrenzia sp. PHM005 TaxID=2590016 RepID=UPI0011405855|nr:SdpI family protein [Labrenzia sp. PHM005]QDG79105.1 hypothetical protein FJ695_26330 [Labrenzia sp. PHM005]